MHARGKAAGNGNTPWEVNAGGGGVAISTIARLRVGGDTGIDVSYKTIKRFNMSSLGTVKRSHNEKSIFARGQQQGENPEKGWGRAITTNTRLLPRLHLAGDRRSIEQFRQHIRIAVFCYYFCTGFDCRHAQIRTPSLLPHTRTIM